MCSALVPLFRNDLLEKAADPDERASRVVGLYGDSARANKLVVTELADKVGCPVVDGLWKATFGAKWHLIRHPRPRSVWAYK